MPARLLCPLPGELRYRRFASLSKGHLSSMGDAHLRVTFDFSGAREVYDTRTAPEIGDFVSHGNDLWVVSRVEADGVDLLITCELPRPPPGAAF
jgi:hypothetical protein